jgi:hypothetical protein
MAHYPQHQARGTKFWCKPSASLSYQSTAHGHRMRNVAAEQPINGVIAFCLAFGGYRGQEKFLEKRNKKITI